MSNPRPDDTVEGETREHAAAAFSLLGNETRLEILLALWEAYEPLSAGSEVSFTELRDRVGVSDSGQFNYHLTKLVGKFVREGDDGYELRDAGHTLVRAVIAGTGIGETTLSPTAIDKECHRCGHDSIRLGYDDATLYLQCPVCEGFIDNPEVPQGTLALWHMDAAGLAHRDPEELLVAGAIVEKNRLRMMLEGVCPDCSGPVDTTLELCDDHQLGDRDLCPNCGMRDSARTRHVCSICKNWNGGPVHIAALDSAPLVSFWNDHGMSLRYDVEDFDGFVHAWSALWAMDHEVLDTDPVRIQVTATAGEERCTVVLDEDLQLIESDRDELTA